MGDMLYIYWHFSEPGDHFLGGVLAGLDPNESELAAMPPRFTMEGNMMDDPNMNDALCTIYDMILDDCRDNPEIDTTGLFLMVLVSVVHHIP